MIITDAIIKKFELVKSDRHTGTSFVNDAKIYETKIFDGMDVVIMDCDLNGETMDVRDKNLLQIVVLRGKGRIFHCLIAKEILEKLGVEIVKGFIKHEMNAYDNNQKGVG